MKEHRCSICQHYLSFSEDGPCCVNISCEMWRIPIMSNSPSVVFGNGPQGTIKSPAPITRPAQAENIWSYRPVTGTQDQQLVESALKGQLGPSQQRIAEVGLDWIATLIKKNTDYGDSAWTEPVLAPNLPPKQAILVRMSDKINRLKALSQKEALVAESYNDTMKDLGAYALLYLAAPETK